jgi:hypothetical protein
MQIVANNAAKVDLPSPLNPHALNAIVLRARYCALELPKP